MSWRNGSLSGRGRHRHRSGSSGLWAARCTRSSCSRPPRARRATLRHHLSICRESLRRGRAREVGNRLTFSAPRSGRLPQGPRRKHRGRRRRFGSRRLLERFPGNTRRAGRVGRARPPALRLSGRRRRRLDRVQSLWRTFGLSFLGLSRRGRGRGSAAIFAWYIHTIITRHFGDRGVRQGARSLSDKIALLVQST